MMMAYYNFNVYILIYHGLNDETEYGTWLPVVNTILGMYLCSTSTVPVKFKFRNIGELLLNIS